MKICILTIGTRGDVQPYIALGLGLKSVGHEVKVATLDEFRSLIQDYGLQHAALRGDFLKVAQTSNEQSPSKGRVDPLRMIRQYTEMARDTLADEWTNARDDVLGLPPAKGEEMLQGEPITKLYAYSESVVPRPADWDASSIVTGYWFLDAPQHWQPDPVLVKFIEDGPPPVYVGLGSMSLLGGSNKTDVG